MWPRRYSPGAPRELEKIVSHGCASLRLSLPCQAAETTGMTLIKSSDANPHPGGNRHLRTINATLRDKFWCLPKQHRSSSDERREKPVATQARGSCLVLPGGKPLSPRPHKSRALVGVGGWGKDYDARKNSRWHVWALSQNAT